VGNDTQRSGHGAARMPRTRTGSHNYSRRIRCQCSRRPNVGLRSEVTLPTNAWSHYVRDNRRFRPDDTRRFACVVHQCIKGGVYTSTPTRLAYGRGGATWPRWQQLHYHTRIHECALVGTVGHDRVHVVRSATCVRHLALPRGHGAPRLCCQSAAAEYRSKAPRASQHTVRATRLPAGEKRCDGQSGEIKLSIRPTPTAAPARSARTACSQIRTRCSDTTAFIESFANHIF